MMGYKVVQYLVLAMSTGMEAAVVTNPENILATKWQKMPSSMYSEKEPYIVQNFEFLNFPPSMISVF